MKDALERCNNSIGEDSVGVRLVEKGKKGISHLLFGRSTIVVALIILQVYLFSAVLNWISRHTPHIIVITLIFLVTLVIVIVNDNGDASAKVTWLLLMMLFPIPGGIFYIFTRTDLGHRMVKKRTLELRNITSNLLDYDEETLEKIKLEDIQSYELCKYINKHGNFPIYSNTKVTYFPTGEDKFEQMLIELEKAEKYIYLEYFIIDEGLMLGRVLEKLIEKVKQGVEVRFLYDGTNEIVKVPYFYHKKLEELGIKCKVFAALAPIISTHYNNRDHRKILVIDGKVAFNGGINLADEYINKKNVYGYWKDTAVMLEGEAVKSFELMFLEMWNVYGKKPTTLGKYGLMSGDEILREYSPEDKSSVKVSGYVMPYGDSPLDDERVGEMVYMDILNRAKNYVHIMTPYLILDAELETALKFAAGRGVDVKIILPGIPDKKAPYSLAKTHFPRLLKAGVKIYIFTPGFVHAKSFVADDERAVVGTINLDYRSLYHHFECATYMYKTECIMDIENDFNETLSFCKEVSIKDWEEEKIGVKLQGILMKGVAPLM